MIGRLTGIVLTFGMTTGVLGGALLGQFAPSPLVTPYLVAGAAVLVTLTGTVLMPEPLQARAPLNVRVRPRVPAQIRGPFWFAAVSAVATWSVLGLYLSLAPGLADQAVGSRDLLVGGTISAALIGTGAVVQLITQRAGALRLALGGDLILGIALLLSVAAVAVHSAWAIYLTAVIMGAGLGPAFSSSLRHLSAVIPAAERGQVMSAYYLTGYLSLAIPAILAGLAATRFGLTDTYLAAPVPVAVRPRRSRRAWLFAGIAAAAVVAAVVALLSALGSGSAPQASSAAPAKAKPAPRAVTPGGPARCPVGTPATALAIANSLASDPVYVDPGSSLLTTAQADRLRAEIGLADPSRIRLAAVAPAALRQGGGERALANAISSCTADAAGVTVVTTERSTYLVTSYTDYQDTSQAVGAALNTHASLAAGLKDAVHRMAAIDPGS